MTDELCSHPVTAEDVNWELGLLPLPPAQLLCSHFKAECFISLASWALSVRKALLGARLTPSPNLNTQFFQGSRGGIV